MNGASLTCVNHSFRWCKSLTAACRRNPTPGEEPYERITLKTTPGKINSTTLTSSQHGIPVQVEQYPEGGAQHSTTHTCAPSKVNHHTPAPWLQRAPSVLPHFTLMIFSLIFSYPLSAVCTPTNPASGPLGGRSKIL